MANMWNLAESESKDKDQVSVYEEVFDPGYQPVNGIRMKDYSPKTLLALIPIFLGVFFLFGVNLNTMSALLFFFVLCLLILNGGRRTLCVTQDEIRIVYGLHFAYFWKSIKISQLNAHQIVKYPHLAFFLNVRGPGWRLYTQIDGHWVRCYSANYGMCDGGVLLNYGDDRGCIIDSQNPDLLNSAIASVFAKE